MLKIRHIPLPLLFLSAYHAHAADTPELFNQIDKDIRGNLNQVHQLEAQNREQSAWEMQKKQNDETAVAELGDEDGQACSERLDYTGIRLSGITLIDAKEIQAELPACINQNTLNRLNKTIIAKYLAKGYPHTQIQFDNTPEGELQLTVTEGKIREIVGSSRTVNINTLFPDHRGQPLNIQYLDQGIEQANYVTGNNVSMDVYPHDDGTASIHLENNPSKPWEGSIAIDNKGSRPNTATVRGSLNIGSPLGLSDSLYLNGYTNLNNSNSHYSRGGSVFYRVPYGAWTFSSYAAAAQSQSILTPSETRYAYRSKYRAGGIKADRIFSRGQKHITSAYAGADYLKQTSTFAEGKLNLQSPEIYSVQAGLSHTSILKKGIWMTNAGIEQGFAKDTEYTPFDKRYTAFLLQSDLIQHRVLGKWAVRNHHQINAQYSPHDLFAAKESDVVGYHSVRGFRSTSISGSRAASLSNTVYFRRELPRRMYIEPYLGADIGIAGGNGGGTQRASAVVAGINLGQAENWRLSADYAKGFTHLPDRENNDRQDHVTVSLRIKF